LTITKKNDSKLEKISDCKKKTKKKPKHKLISNTREKNITYKKDYIEENIQ
jgi:hypothetical protein